MTLLSKTNKATKTHCDRNAQKLCQQSAILFKFSFHTIIYGYVADGGGCSHHITDLLLEEILKSVYYGLFYP